jgi:hypothetical protein
MISLKFIFIFKFPDVNKCTPLSHPSHATYNPFDVMPLCGCATYGKTSEFDMMSMRLTFPNITYSLASFFQYHYYLRL